MGYEDEESGGGVGPYQPCLCEPTCCINLGGVAWLFLGLCTVSWIFHAFPIMGTTDTPQFARSLLWSSIAHHTDAWKDAYYAYPPPPPTFGDGLGNYPDIRRR